jgi:antitoxin Phd
MVTNGSNWKLEDAKARFSELVRVANSSGPQRVTVRGKDRAVVISASDYERLKNAGKRKPLVAFMEGLGLDGLQLDRDGDTGREIEL